MKRTELPNGRVSFINTASLENVQPGEIAQSDNPVPVVIVSDGLIEDIVGLKHYLILDHDTMEYNNRCPYCGEDELSVSSDTAKPWICPGCGTDLNDTSRDNEQDAEIKRLHSVIK